MDPDLNKYDLEHATMAHPRMSKRRVGAGVSGFVAAFIIRREHMKTVMRRAAATGISAGNMLFLLIWYYGCVGAGEDSSAAGRLSAAEVPRTNRRPTLPRENPLVFYPRYIGEMIWKHLRLAREIVHLYGIRRRLKRDPAARSYMDQALTPVTETDAESLEMFTIVQ